MDIVKLQSESVLECREILQGFTLEVNNPRSYVFHGDDSYFQIVGIRTCKTLIEVEKIELE